MSLEDRFYPLLEFYNGLPKWMRLPLGRGYRSLPSSWRLGKHFSDFEDLTCQGEHWTSEQIEAYQTEQLRLVLQHAARHCPFYQKAFAKSGFDPARVQSGADLATCPLLEKKDLLEHLPELTSDQFPASHRLYITTGGSTGVPVGFYLHKGISRPKEQAFLEAMWRRAGYFPGARLAVIRGQTTSLKASGRIQFYDATRDWLILSSYHLTSIRLPEYLEALERFKPDFLHAYPSAALQLAGFLEDAGHCWRVPLRGLLCGSEQLALPEKRFLEKFFKCRVYRWYGHSERAVLAGEGRSSELFYFFPQYGFVEFGPPDEEDLCEVIGTSFHNLVMPLIRYRTGDYVQLAEPGKSGHFEWPWPAAVSISGRGQEFLVSATGRRISLTAFNLHDSSFDGLYAVQFYQEEPGVAEFRFLPRPQFHRSRLSVIQARIREKLGDDFRVEMREVKEVEKTARGKHRWLVSRLPEARLRAKDQSVPSLRRDT